VRRTRHETACRPGGCHVDDRERCRTTIAPGGKRAADQAQEKGIHRKAIGGSSVLPSGHDLGYGSAKQRATSSKLSAIYLCAHLSRHRGGKRARPALIDRFKVKEMPIGRLTFLNGTRGFGFPSVQWRPKNGAFSHISETRATLTWRWETVSTSFGAVLLINSWIAIDSLTNEGAGSPTVGQLRPPRCTRSRVAAWRPTKNQTPQRRGYSEQSNRADSQSVCPRARRPQDTG